MVLCLSKIRYIQDREKKEECLEQLKLWEEECSCESHFERLPSSKISGKTGSYFYYYLSLAIPASVILGESLTMNDKERTEKLFDKLCNFLSAPHSTEEGVNIVSQFCIDFYPAIGRDTRGMSLSPKYWSNPSDFKTINSYLPLGSPNSIKAILPFPAKGLDTILHKILLYSNFTLVIVPDEIREDQENCWYGGSPKIESTGNSLYLNKQFKELVCQYQILFLGV